MKLTFSPMRRDDRLTLGKTGDTLTINGEAFDFSGIPEGATLPRDAVACEWLVSDIERVSGDLHLTLILPHGADAPQGALFPVPIIVTGDGSIDLPAHSLMEVEPVE